MLYFILPAWMIISGATVLMNTFIFTSCDFHYPIFLTACHMLSCSVCVRLLCERELLPKPDAVQFTRQYITKMSPVAIFFALSVFLSNSAYMYLSVVYIQMMKALMVLVVYCTSCALGVDLFRRGTVGRLCIVTAGVLLASYGETHFSLIGVVLQIGSIVSESLRLVLSQKLMQSESKKPMSSVDMMYHISPIAFVVLVPLFLAFELTDMVHSGMNLPLGILLVNVILVFLLNLTSYAVIEHTSALLINLAGVIKDWSIIVVLSMGFAVFTPSVQLIGYLIAFDGVLLYNAYDRKKSIVTTTKTAYELVSKDEESTVV